MRDNIDKANDLAQRELDSTLKNRTPKFVGESATHCQDCDEPIPERRRQLLAGCQLCVDCQSLNERRR
ncbi:TraR/DksA family transcriptional regulator [Utexia brackfieldae]|uniref:TraR/DksA family transcriptional regulator n=1 Tax=Utexia brackfieldae TaxID=3074108 RepID=UPI00370D91BC